MKHIQVEFIWRQIVTLSVEDDWTIPVHLDDFTDEQLEEVSPVFAELVDWGRA